MKKSKACLLLAAIIATTTIGTACTKNTEKASGGSDIDLSSYPIKTDVKLTYYMPLRSESAGIIENYSESSFAKEYEKRTGVKIEYIHPPVGQEAATLGLLIASGELPDIMQNNWTTYQGGVSGAVNDEVIVPLNDYKEYAPAYFKKLSENPLWDKIAKNDEGYYSGFEFLQGSSKLRNVCGPAIRMDWLNELGLSIPETLEDWETVLTAFKEKKGATAPLSTIAKGQMYTMFGAHYGLYIDGDQYKHGYAEPEMKEALIRMNDWFKKGLLDKNIVTVDAKAVDTQVLTGQTGAVVATGGDIGRYMTAASEDGFDLTGIRYPLINGKDNSSMCVVHPLQCYTAAISAQCKHPELAAKVLDYLYTEEGEILANFGVEGETFEMVDGKPIYKDIIAKNPDGLSMMEALSLHVKAGAVGPYECQVGYIEQYYGMPQQQSALNAWQIGFEESEAHRTLPVSLFQEEAQEASDITTELSKYSNQQLYRFITGQDSIDKFDKYVEEMNSLGLPRLLEIYTEALKRFNNR
ncbi:MAG: extracellular solute-binding protein [Clostridia bacterium]|nr:extracellular solute-binding protein [Clostridia bacterium]